MTTLALQQSHHVLQAYGTYSGRLHSQTASATLDKDGEYHSCESTMAHSMTHGRSFILGGPISLNVFLNTVQYAERDGEGVVHSASF